ncbi:MAG TPA: prolipoprotein diacylglyceryl transferase [Oligoflexia bacterium]|nr:prolipoprotein diacylglyceryl transferase [Oligoflexia bacterium]
MFANNNQPFYWGVTAEAFSLGPLHIRWYGLLFAFAFLAGYRIVAWVFARENKPSVDLDPLFITMFLGTVLGARLGHCLLYEPGFYLSHPLEILKIWQGGLASHGAGIGMFIALYLYARRRNNQPYLWLLSRMTIVVALGGALIRLGNFFNSEIIGKPTDIWWAVVFAHIDSLPRHPAQLYESLAYLAVFIVLVYLYRRTNPRTNQSLLLGFFLSTVFIMRFLIEFLKEPQVEFERRMMLDLGQILSLPLIFLGLLFLYQWGRNFRKEPPQ